MMSCITSSLASASPFKYCNVISTPLPIQIRYSALTAKERLKTLTIVALVTIIITQEQLVCFITVYIAIYYASNTYNQRQREPKKITTFEAHFWNLQKCYLPMQKITATSTRICRLIGPIKKAQPLLITKQRLANKCNQVIGVKDNVT